MRRVSPGSLSAAPVIKLCAQALPISRGDAGLAEDGQPEQAVLSLEGVSLGLAGYQSFVTRIFVQDEPL